MHYNAIKKNHLIQIRTVEGEFEGRALEQKEDHWLLEGGLKATRANLVRIIRKKPSPDLTTPKPGL